MIHYENPVLQLPSDAEPGSVEWQSPSNIAIVKYWGKHGTQLPRNPSVSFTLDQCFTRTRLHYAPLGQEEETGIRLAYYFEGQHNEAFEQKVARFLQSLLPVFPFLGRLRLRIDSSNSFPHSTGIASSASSMSALALCLCSLEQRLFGTPGDQAAFLRKASYLARLGSGSACRSVYPVMALWGATPALEEASDLYAVPCADRIHEVFATYRDTVLIVSSEEKSVSSRVGHGLMEDNPYAPARYREANQRLEALLEALRTGDEAAFGLLAEAEALTLHALMMASRPPFILMKPGTLLILDKIRRFRNDTGLPLHFTLDAGPNVHLLFPDRIGQQVDDFIRSQLLPHCENGRHIADRVGRGPVESITV